MSRSDSQSSSTARTAKDDRLQQILKAAEVGTWEWHVRTNQVIWSDNIEDLFGLAPGTFARTYEAWLALVHPEDRAKMAHAVARSLETKDGYDTEFRVVRPDGSIRWQSTRSHVICEGGEVVAVAGVVQDVTARVTAEARLHETMRQAEAERERLHGVLLAAPANIALLRGPDYRYELSSLANDTQAGMALTGKRVADILPQATAQGLTALLDRVYRTGEPMQFTAQPVDVLDAQGRMQQRYYNGYFQATRDVQGKIDGIAHFAFEVTEQVRALRRVEESEKNYRHIFEGAGVAIWEQDYSEVLSLVQRLRGEGVQDFMAHFEAYPEVLKEALTQVRLCQVNPASVRMLQAENVETLVSNLPSIWVAETLPFFGRQIVAMAEGKSYFDGETVIQTLCGERIHVWMTLTLPSTEQPGFALVTLSDITERKRHAAERDKLVRELGAAVHARDEFLSVASHELKTPLTPLRLKLDVLARDAAQLPNDPFALKVRRTVEAGLKQLDKLAALIGDLLDVSRIAGGRFDVRSEPADLVVITREIVSRYEAAAAEAGCVMTLDAPANASGVWDKLRLDQVVTNLVDNAIKYGQGKPIVIAIHTSPDWVRVSVKDEGIGIGLDAMKRIFGRFERAVSERHFGGLGLGLYISQTIVEAMGGRIQVESTLGKGALFEVVLPRVATQRTGMTQLSEL